MSNNRILFYGPPCSGKSTLIKKIHKLGVENDEFKYSMAIDLECIDDPNKKQLQNFEQRAIFAQLLQIFKYSKAIFVAAANVEPHKDLDLDKWKVVGLIPEDDEKYLERIKNRNPDEKQECIKFRNAIRGVCNQLNDDGRLALQVDPLRYETAEDLLCEILQNLGI